MTAGHQLHRLTVRGVPGNRAVVCPIQTHTLGQQMRVTGVALGPRGGVALPVPCRRQRVDREHLVTCRDQRRHPRAAVGLDANLHPRLRLARIQLSPVGRHEPRDYQRMQTRDPVQPLGQPLGGQASTGVIDDFHVVMILGPVVPYEQHRSSSVQHRTPSAARRRQPAI